jgi:hypothetical protein
MPIFLILLLFAAFLPVDAQDITGRSMRGRMRLVNKSSVVFGEKFQVELTMPPRAEDEATWGNLYWGDTVALDWAGKEKADSMPYTKEVPIGHTLSGGVFVIEVTAPFFRPGRYDLRLYHAYKLIDVLQIPVVKGWVTDGVIPAKEAYRPGEAIDVQITLPENRYYSGHWSGPTVQLVPIEINGRRLTPKEEEEWLAQCQCQTWLSNFLNSGQKNPHDDGVGVRSGTFLVKMEQLDKQGLIRHPLHAPKESGRYELRLYDRGFASEWSSYSDLFIATSEIVVQAEDAIAKVAGIKFVRKTDQGFEPVPGQTLSYGDLFAIEVTMESDTGPADKSRVVQLDWGEGEQRKVEVHRQSARVFRSKVFRLEPPKKEKSPSQ